MTFLAFVVLGAIMLIILGRIVTPPAQKKPFRSWKMDDYGATMRRGVVLMLDAGARNRWRMENMHNQSRYSERGRMDGDRLPTDETVQPPEQIPPGAIPPHMRSPDGGIQYRTDGYRPDNDPSAKDSPEPPEPGPTDSSGPSDSGPTDSSGPPQPPTAS